MLKKIDQMARWWIENICGWMAGPPLDTVPYTGWVGGWELEREESHCLQVSLVSGMPEALDDGAVYSIPQSRRYSTLGLAPAPQQSPVSFLHPINRLAFRVYPA